MAEIQSGGADCAFLEDEGIDEIVVFDKLPDLEVGHYNKLKLIAMRAGTVGQGKNKGEGFLITEVEVLEATGHAPSAPGTKATIRIHEGGYELYHQRDMKSLAGAITGEGSEIKNARTVLKGACDGEYKGAVFAADVFPNPRGTQNPKTGKVYINVRTSPCVKPLATASAKK